MNSKKNAAKIRFTERQQLKKELTLAEMKKNKLRLISRIFTTVGIIIVAVLVSYGLLNSRSTESTLAIEAPAFTLQTTSGSTVSLSDYLGESVILYFNEGAGCGSCTQQMLAIENDPSFAKAGIIVLPIVMNTKAQIQPDLKSFGVKTPYLLDDGTVSKAYGVLGKGMHAGLPGHGFVLIDSFGIERWQADYPSMWLDPTILFETAQNNLGK